MRDTGGAPEGGSAVCVGDATGAADERFCCAEEVCTAEGGGGELKIAAPPAVIAETDEVLGDD